MEAKEVRYLPWKEVEDWSALCMTGKTVNFWGHTVRRYVTQEDVDIFVSRIFNDIAKKLKIPYEDLKPILDSENGPFYAMEGRIFEICYGLLPDGRRLRALQRTLRIPDVSALDQTDSADKVGACVKQFEELSDLEKVIFLERIGKVSVKVETCAKGVPETTEN